MTVGPLLAAAGVLLLVPVGSGTTYLTGVLPGVVVFALGMAALVSPLTATVLAAAPDEDAGVASGVNNAVARAGSLLAVAALPAVVGLSGSDYADPVVLYRGLPLQGSSSARRSWPPAGWSAGSACATRPAEQGVGHPRRDPVLGGAGGAQQGVLLTGDGLVCRVDTALAQ